MVCCRKGNLKPVHVIKKTEWQTQSVMQGKIVTDADLINQISLISAFVVRCQDRMIPLVYISEISRF